MVRLEFAKRKLICIGSDLHVSQCGWSSIPEALPPTAGGQRLPFTLRFERTKQLPSYSLSKGASEDITTSDLSDRADAAVGASSRTLANKPTRRRSSTGGSTGGKAAASTSGSTSSDYEFDEQRATDMQCVGDGDRDHRPCDRPTVRPAGHG